MPQSDLFKPQTLSVSQLTSDIKQLLEGNFLDLKIEGEISNAKKSVSDHIYFTLKDDSAQLSCVIWRSTVDRLGTKLVDGQQIVAGGDISVYPPHGKYQLIVRTVEQAGKGALQEAFERLKKQLKTEGLFDDKHKQPLPQFPKTIGVITSATGAAFHDICDTLAKRWPLAEVRLHHASVQGVNAAPELVHAINYFSKAKSVDVLIVGRGGGSLEDLWPFNEEAVARAIFNCKIPVISAVGHEVDFSISDFVADARASTPTQAAVIAVPDMNEIKLFVDSAADHLQNTIGNRISVHRDKIDKLISSYAFMAFKEKLTAHHKQINRLTERLTYQKDLLLMKKKEQLSAIKAQLKQANPEAPLEKGYVRIEQDENWIKRARHFDKEVNFEMHWKDSKVPIKN
ncbi:MAG TPA: exodeoxyribonuclease VII large subunit [Balneolaceae bacterium]|nr:exodeoxyribonuclease VII large subunit [Balneolaceae bacterium]